MAGGFLDCWFGVAQIPGQRFVGVILWPSGNAVFGVQPGTEVDEFAALAAEGEELREWRRFPRRSPQGAFAVWAGQLALGLWLLGLHWLSHSGFRLGS